MTYDADDNSRKCYSLAIKTMRDKLESCRWVCENCGTRFSRDKSGDRPIRFCTLPCYHAWRKKSKITAGQFSPGHVPWNKDIKGLRLSPKSEFKKGRKSEKWLPVGTETVRTDKQGKERVWVKISEPNNWKERARVVWEKYRHKIPKGCVIHHKDRDTLNDYILNLECMTRAEHINEHRKDLLAAKPIQETLSLKATEE